MLKSRLGLALSLVAGASLVLAPAASASSRRALGANGEVYEVVQEAYGNLFPGGSLTLPEHSVLVLERSRPGGGVERLLVPDTLGPEVEASPSLVVEASSDTVYLLWESNYIHSQLKLAGWSAAGWSDVIDVSGNSFVYKNSPQLAVTRDAFELLTEGGEPVLHYRTVLHTVWWESSAGGEQVLYTPLVLVDGAYVGSHSVYSLNELVGELPGTGNAAGEALLEAPTIAPGADPQSVVAAFTDRVSGRLLALEIRLLPGELIQLGDEIEAYLTLLGGQMDLSTAEGLEEVTDLARAQIILVGHRLRTAVLDHLADQVERFLREHDAGEELESMTDGARAQIILVGARMAGNSLTQLTDPARAQIILVGARTGPRNPAHYARLQVASSRPAPVVGEGPVSVYLSADGSETLVAWRQGDDLLYRESSGQEWSDVHGLALGPDLDLESAHEVLQRRIRDR